VRRVSILGSTGSIGRSALDVVRTHQGAIDVVALSAFKSVEVLAEQIKEFSPALAVVGTEAHAERLREMIGESDTEIAAGAHGLERAAAREEADIVLNALVGAAGIMPSLAAIRAGNDLAIANKECLVAAGEVITREAHDRGVELIPVDSEHSAVFQCLKAGRRTDVERITLTASGGPLKDMERPDISRVSAEDALKHPTWSMGRKVTIDSATLMNKGFEVIEAHWLFGIPTERIEVLVESKSLVHCLVEFTDGAVLALMSVPDMRLPIQYALTQPERVPSGLPRLDVVEIGEIKFEPPDTELFPCLDLAYAAARLEGTAPAVLSAADEVAVESFLAARIKFGDIYTILKEVVDSHDVMPADSLDAVMKATEWARGLALSLVAEIDRGS
jgi:1-deoxy-D-xylulose-5-phosphate reductoisomerase